MSDLTTIAKVKAYLGISDSSADDILTDIVATVSNEIEIYCNRQFELDTYEEQIIGTGEISVLLPNTPIDGIIFVGAGRSSAISLTYDGATTGFVEVATNEVRLVSGLTQTNIAIGDNDSIATVVASITADSDWTATVQSTEIGLFPGASLINRTYGNIQGTQQVSMQAAISDVQLVQEADGLYLCNPIGGIVKVLYDGGYTTIPTNLEQLATQMSADMYKSTSHEAGLKGERIGSYSYSRVDGVKSTLFAYTDRLDFYKLKVI